MRKALVVALVLVATAAAAAYMTTVVGMVTAKETVVTTVSTANGTMVTVTDYLSIAGTRARCADSVSATCRNAVIGSTMFGVLLVDRNRRTWEDLVVVSHVP